MERQLGLHLRNWPRWLSLESMHSKIRMGRLDVSSKKFYGILRNFYKNVIEPIGLRNNISDPILF